MAKLTERQQRQLQYTTKLLGAIQEGCFDEEAPNKIDLKDFNDEEKLTDFIHALANCVPNQIFGKLKGSEVNNLEFNHIANRLCFQNSTLE